MSRVLHIVGGMGRGGQETFIMNLYRAIDREKVQFDFIVHDTKERDYDKEIYALGGKIHHVARKQKNFFKNLYEIKKIVHDNDYVAVHRHSNSSFFIFFDLLAAKCGGAKIRIAHSHSTNTLHKKLHFLFRPLLNIISTHRFACSDVAGKWLYGRKKFQIINNGIDLSQYIFSHEEYKKVRSELKIENKYVVGHVGRFNIAKNHGFLLDIFYEIHNHDKNTILLLVGDGELRSSIETKIKELHLENCVMLVGVRSDVCKILKGMDMFLFPSLYEGLPVSVVEAQSTGLPVILSNNITKEVKITNRVISMSLQNSAQEWARKILNYDRNQERKSEINLIKEAGFDVNDIVMKLQKIYLGC